MNDLKKFAPNPDEVDAKLDAGPVPVKGPFGGSTWMNNHAYPLVKPEHGSDLEQASAINEFGKKMPREQAEAEAYKAYKLRQHVEAAAHHLAGTKAAHAAGDMEAARKHSLMYDLHSKAIGHEPVGPAHPDVVAQLANASKVYRFKPHHGDQLALSAKREPEPQGTQEPTVMDKHETLGLNAVYVACQALLKGELEKKSPPGRKEEVEKLKAKGLPASEAFGIAWKQSNAEAKKAEMTPRAKGPKPCICPSYNFPHRHKSGKCGK